MMKISFIFILLNILILQVGCGSKTDPGYVAQQWSVNTSQLGIYPLFPPRERFFPGDIYVVPVASDKTIAKLPGKYYVIRPIRYDHVDIHTLLNNEQSAPIVFPKTQDWNDVDGNQFKAEPFQEYPSAQNRMNSVVVFPGFTFASSKGGALGLNIPTGTWGASGVFGRESDYTVAYSVPNAEMVSIPLREAIPEFKKYRAALGGDGRAMTDLRWLTDSMGTRINNLASKIEFRDFSSLKPAVVMVTDVYYTRRLNVTITSEKGFNLSASATLTQLVNLSEQAKAIEAALGKLEPATVGNGGATQPAKEGTKGAVSENVKGTDSTTAGAKGAAAESGTGADSTVGSKAANQSASGKPQVAQTDAYTSAKAQLDTLKNNINEMTKSFLPGVPGAKGTIISATSAGISLEQVFPYPVAIGYSAIVCNADDFFAPGDALTISACFKESSVSVPMRQTTGQ